ncbi:integrase family domain-containing protein [Rhizobium etli 8C-3]|uniref:Phage integrase family protein n=2 Tax=Rhizobium TaxID=379 RepID=A0A4R3QGV9_9HYPH|nr:MULTISPECIES: site-specific integrase [Rhizobium]APO74668.1 integrase family domain-containing protein [Rhizobium etli 8C-3]TCU20781.1 phage integrase family protein [Rhizobium azibense]TCU35158.1 phage integrase family protein [Rhizobium azibense]
MADWTKQAGLPKGYTLHGLRHTFGSLLAEANLQTRAVMEAMGHTDLKSTEHYMRRINQRRIMIDAARSLNDHGETTIAVNKPILRIVK